MPVVGPPIVQNNVSKNYAQILTIWQAVFLDIRKVEEQILNDQFVFRVLCKASSRELGIDTEGEPLIGKSSLPLKQLEKV